jgi:hypothetical protein
MSDPNAACSLLSPTDPFQRVFVAVQTWGHDTEITYRGPFVLNIDVWGFSLRDTGLSLDEVLAPVRAARLIL